MKLDNNYDSKIGNLFPKNKPNDYFFISDWDLHNADFSIDSAFFYSKLYAKANYSINDYFFINERFKEKSWLINNCDLTLEKQNNKIDFSIFPNGTTAADTIIQILNKDNKMIPLLISPVYFTYIDILKDNNCMINYYPILSSQGQYKFNINDIIKLIVQEKINMIIITYPIFGSGITIDIMDLKQLLQTSKKYNINILIDYIYGDLEWNNNLQILPKTIINDINENTVLLTSLSKNLFLNGAKTCLVFSNSELIKKIEKASVYKIGSMSQSQLEVFKLIYNKENKTMVLNILKKIRTHVQHNYEQIKSLCSSSSKGLLITECKSGIFCLLGIPKSLFEINKTDDDISKIIMEKSNILTIPHSRYLMCSSSYYWFRVNLSYSQELLIPQIYKLLQIDFN